MKVLFVSPSADLVTGLGSWLDVLLPEMSRQGQRGVIGLASGPVWHRADRYRAAHPGPATRRVHTRTCTPEGRCRALVRVLRDEQPDVVVPVHMPDTYRAVSRLRAEGAFRGRCLATIHSFSADVAQDICRYRPVIDAVASPSRLLCAVLQRLAGLSGEEVFHARGGVAAPPAGRGQRPPRPFCVGIACRLSQPQKRVLDGGSAWMELRRRHPEVRLLVAGSGENEAALRDLLRDELASGQAEFLGALSPSDMDRAFYPRVDAVLISSPAEVGPLVAWEAMAREIPVVSSRFLGCRTERALVHGLTALLFDVGDTQAAARRLSELLTDRALSRSIAEQGRAFAEQHCSAAGCGAQWAEVFAQVAALRAREPAGMGTCVQAAGGWLDARLGPVLAESVRRFLPSPSRRVLTCSSAEWPHTHSACAADEQARFMALAAELERDAT